MYRKEIFGATLASVLALVTLTLLSFAMQSPSFLRWNAQHSANDSTASQMLGLEVRPAADEVIASPADGTGEIQQTSYQEMTVEK